MLSRDLIKTITDLRSDPIKLFALAKKKNSPFFIFNRSEPIGVVLSWRDYEEIEEKLEDLRDIVELKEAKATSEELIGWEKVRKRLTSNV
jgi:prevent-host-death family protein